MRWGVVLLAGCGFPSLPPVGGSVDAPGMLDDGGHELGVWGFDTADQFAAGAFDQMGIEPWGALTPAAYIPGGVLVHGTNAALWSAEADDSTLVWDPVTTATVAGVGVWRLEDLGAAETPQFGVSTMSYSLWIEGELRLDAAGVHQFQLVADDVGFLEVQAPETGMFQRIVISRVTQSVQTGTYTAAAPGWVRFRIGYAQNSGGRGLHVLHAEPGSGFAKLDRAHVRGRGDGLRGLERTTFEQQLLATAREQIAIDPGDLIDAPSIQHFGTTGSNDNWSARWTGQYYVEQPGAYTVTAVSDDGNHLFFAGQDVSDHFARGDSDANATSAATATLAAGWQPIVVDYNQNGGGANLSVRVTAAPDSALVGHPLAADHLRPVETSKARFIALANTGQSANIPDGSGSNGLMITAVSTPDETVRAIELTVHITSTHWDQIGIELVRPGGTFVGVCHHDCAQTSGFVQARITSGIVGGPAAGLWYVRVSDDVVGGSGASALTDAYLGLHTTGGPDTIAKHAVWTSPVLELGARPAVGVSSVVWNARTSATSSAAVQLRACQVATCDGVAWSDPVASGGVPVLTLPAPYLQARVAIETDGELEADLDELEVHYLRPAP